MTEKKPSKFKGHKPLRYIITNRYADKCDLHYQSFEEPKPIELFKLSYGEVYHKKLPILSFGIKAHTPEFDSCDFLWSPDGADFVVHDRALEIFKELCPGDFQTFEMVIKNLNPKDPPFENKSYHMINVTNRIEALDMEKSAFHKSPNGILFPTKRIYKEYDCWEGHLLSREKLEGNIIFHPKLAKRLKNCKGIKFLRDTDR